MDSELVDARPQGVSVVILLTALYSVERLLTSAARGSLLLGGPSGAAFWAGWPGLTIAYLLWRGHHAGWVAAVVLYAFLLFDLGLGAAVFGLTEVPLVGVALVVLVYLVLRRDRFRTPSSETDQHDTQSSYPESDSF